MVAEYNLIIPQGADFLNTLTLLNDDGTPINLTGYSFVGQIRKTYNATKVQGQFSFTILNQATRTGQVEIRLDDDWFAVLLENKISFVYDIEMTSPSGYVTKVLFGSLTLIPEVTR